MWLVCVSVLSVRCVCWVVVRVSTCACACVADVVLHCNKRKDAQNKCVIQVTVRYDFIVTLSIGASPPSDCIKDTCTFFRKSASKPATNCFK